MTPDATPAKILLYDGACGLCTASVQFVLKRQRDRSLRFAPLQGPTAAGLRAELPQIPADLSTVVFVQGGRAHLRAKAFLYLMRELRGPWRWLSPLRVLPAFLLDLPYRLIARIRYRVWGQACMVPSPQDRAQFLP